MMSGLPSGRLELESAGACTVVCVCAARLCERPTAVGVLLVLNKIIVAIASMIIMPVLVLKTRGRSMDQCWTIGEWQ